MRLLVIGDLDGHFLQASKIAIDQGAKVRHVATIDQALLSLRSGQGADLCFIDIHQDIRQFIACLTSEKICLPIVACGVEVNQHAAVDAIKAGAKEYITLPPNKDIIAALLRSIAEDTHELSFISSAMSSILAMAEKIASSDASVLITGKSGTGKEIMSRFIHNHSSRKDKPFVAVNCAAIPDNLIESELFGHEKGAFTGAVARRIGKFEEAHNGTLLLDEISEIDPKIQAKLLRVIQEQEITRIGGTGSVKLNVRILATSNRNLREEIQAGRFREDLFFRLNIINIRLPDLAKRKEDVPQFVDYFIQKYCKSNKLPIKSIAPAAMERLLEHSWPGNIRELENTIYRAVLLAGEVINIEDLQLDCHLDNNSNIDSHTLKEIDILAVNIASLQEKINKLGVKSLQGA